MAYLDNRPPISRLERQLQGSELDVDQETLEEILEASIADIEDKAATSFNSMARHERRDGNGGITVQLQRRPISRIDLVKVELPVLALTRTYTPSEVKVYSLQGVITIFTYKLAAEQASLHLDQMVYGNLMPPLPQVVHIDYCYGFAQYDPDEERTTFDGGATSVEGDQRDVEAARWLKQLQQAAVCDAAASVLAQLGGLKVGVLQSVSFDGYSQSMNPQAYGPQVDALIQRRDQLLGRRKRMNLATVGGRGL